MENLIGLCIFTQKLNSLGVDCLGLKKDKPEELYDIVVDGVSNRVDAKKKLFDSRYDSQLLYSAECNLYNRLTNTILSTPDQTGSEHLVKLKALSKTLSLFNYLIAKGQRKIAIPIGEKALKESIKFGFTSIAVDFLKGLSRHYSAFDANRKKFTFYLELFKEYSTIYSYEMQAEALLSEASFITTGKKFRDKKQIDELRKCCNAAYDIVKEAKSFRIIIACYNVIAYYNSICNDYEQLVETCQAALNQMNKLESKLPHTARFSFLIKMIPALLINKNYELAEATINKCIEIVPFAKHNWVVSNQYKIILLLQKEQYDEAIKTIKEVRKKKTKHIISKQEIFNIYETYANVLAGNKGKMMNELPEFSKDKKGMNVNLLVLQMLFLLREGKNGKVLDRIESIRRYTYRHLKGRSDIKTLRSNAFLNALVQFDNIKGDFRKVVFQRKSQKYLNQLLDTPVKSTGQDFQLEIIPFEKLYDFTISCLN